MKKNFPVTARKLLQNTPKCAIVKAQRTKEDKGMYVLQVKYRGGWRVGQNRYDTIEAAQKRVAELKAVGITARVRLTSEVIG